MKRDLKGKKMPPKPMREIEADEELALDLPSDDMLSDEEFGAEEADADLLPLDEDMASDMFADISDDDLLAEVEKRGLSMDQAEEADEEMTDAEAVDEELV